jgi:hypothetical protein
MGYIGIIYGLYRGYKGVYRDYKGVIRGICCVSEWLVYQNGQRNLYCAILSGNTVRVEGIGRGYRT